MGKKYSKTKIAITIDTDTLKKLDKIKEYPKWRNNRSSVIEAALENFLEEQQKNG